MANYWLVNMGLMSITLHHQNEFCTVWFSLSGYVKWKINRREVMRYLYELL